MSRRPLQIARRGILARRYFGLFPESEFFNSHSPMQSLTGRAVNLGNSLRCGCITGNWEVTPVWGWGRAADHSGFKSTEAPLAFPFPSHNATRPSVTIASPQRSGTASVTSPPNATQNFLLDLSLASRHNRPTS